VRRVSVQLPVVTLNPACAATFSHNSFWCGLSVLEKYELPEYSAIVDGIRTGNLRKFNDALIEFQHIFIR